MAIIQSQPDSLWDQTRLAR